VTYPPPESTPTPEPQEPPPLGEKTGSAILALLQDFYRQEIGAEEDVHRTLPFFATALGLIVAALSYGATQIPTWAKVMKACSPPPTAFASWDTLRCAWPFAVTIIALALVLILVSAVLLHLFRATRPRDYQRVGKEPAIVERARALRVYHAARNLTDTAADDAVATDLRTQLIDDFARVIPPNRALTLERYHARARAVTSLLWSLFFAFVATILIVAITKFGLLPG
jgi:hypothetical protein